GRGRGVARATGRGRAGGGRPAGPGQRLRRPDRAEPLRPPEYGVPRQLRRPVRGGPRPRPAVRHDGDPARPGRAGGAADPGRGGELVPGWAAEQCTRLKLDPDGLLARLKGAADAAVGQPVEPLLAMTLDPLVPRGWRPKLPDPNQVTLAFAHLDKLIGTPLL